ncbi:MAG: hypothetical protein IPJ13_21100 [Saprospiraceae bacterium]|nr:hypothetical protein [Saprospiraceae bacterium]
MKVADIVYVPPSTLDTAPPPNQSAVNVVAPGAELRYTVWVFPTKISTAGMPVGGDRKSWLPTRSV